MPLDQKTIELAQGPNFAVFTTLRPDGHPVSQPMWVDSDGEHILINTEPHRRKFRNISNDPRVTVTIWERDNPYHYVEVRGRVTDVITGDRPRAHIDELSELYDGQPYDADSIKTERVMLVITPLETSKKSS
jgi:PPOX class probable F420-dependent enzyme